MWTTARAPADRWDTGYSGWGSVESSQPPPPPQQHPLPLEPALRALVLGGAGGQWPGTRQPGRSPRDTGETPHPPRRPWVGRAGAGAPSGGPWGRPRPSAPRPAHPLPPAPLRGPHRLHRSPRSRAWSSRTLRPQARLPPTAALRTGPAPPGAHPHPCPHTHPLCRHPAPGTGSWRHPPHPVARAGPAVHPTPGVPSPSRAGAHPWGQGRRPVWGLGYAGAGGGPPWAIWEVGSGLRLGPAPSAPCRPPWATTPAGPGPRSLSLGVGPPGPGVWGLGRGGRSQGARASTRVPVPTDPGERLARVLRLRLVALSTLPVPRGLEALWACPHPRGLPHRTPGRSPSLQGSPRGQ